MAAIVVTWDNPSDIAKARAADAKAADWRATVLKQPGILEFNAMTSRHSPLAGMAVDSFSSASAAGAFLGSDQFAKIVSEMTELGVTNIKATLWDQHPDVPKALRPQ